MADIYITVQCVIDGECTYLYLTVKLSEIAVEQLIHDDERCRRYFIIYEGIRYGIPKPSYNEILDLLQPKWL